MGGFCPVTRPRSPGRFRESPPPLCRAGAAAPGRRPGFSQAGGCLGPESPRPESRASVVGGPRSRVRGAAPEPPSSAWRPGPAAPTLSDLTRVGVCYCPRVLAAAVPLTSARKGGARLPVSPPGARPGSGRLPSLVLPGWLARPPRASVALARGSFPRSCDWYVGNEWTLPRSWKHSERQGSQPTGAGWTEQTLDSYLKYRTTQPWRHSLDHSRQMDNKQGNMIPGWWLSARKRRHR